MPIDQKRVSTYSQILRLRPLRRYPVPLQAFQLQMDEGGGHHHLVD